MNWKELLKQLIILVATSLFSVITGKWPEFPLDLPSWVDFVVWVFMALGIINGVRFGYFKLTKTVD